MASAFTNRYGVECGWDVTALAHPYELTGGQIGNSILLAMNRAMSQKASDAHAGILSRNYRISFEPMWEIWDTRRGCIGDGLLNFAKKGNGSNSGNLGCLSGPPMC